MYPHRHVLILVAFVAAYGFLEVATLARTRAKVRVASRDWTFYAVTIPGMLSIYVPLVVAFFSRAPVARQFFAVGLILFVCGCIIRIRGVSELAGFFSTDVERREGHALVSRGLHAVIRHPAYLGTILLSFAVPIALRSQLWLFVFPVLTVAGELLRIRKEEAFLIKNLPGYDEYMKKTRRLIPGVY
ncbi:MAG TPA: isoprenylcysteine carboxylmethyltransferase family protein [bacterium]|nr:isoprenylcysteine carboxylmethyltransferase family protein [bacterium]